MECKKSIYYEYFEKNILPIVEEIEKERVKKVKSLILSSVSYFILACILIFAFVFVKFGGIFKILYFPLILFLVYAFILKGIINFIIECRNFQNMLYEKVMPLFLQPFANFKPWPNNHNTEDIIDSKLFHNFDTQEDVKSFFGFYNKTNVIVSDTRLTMPVKGVNKPNLFKGTLIQLEFEKSINNHVIMFSKNERKYNKYHQVNPKIDDMNKYMYVFAKNDNNLDFITEKFWNEIKKFGKVFTAKGFELSFNNNIMLIAVRQKRPMVFGFLFQSLLKAKNYDELIDRFIVILNVVDILNKD